MSISAISNAGAYVSASSTGNQSNIEQLKTEEQKLQNELKQLERSSSGKDVQQEEKNLEQRISHIEQQIQQAENSSSASTAQQQTFVSTASAGPDAEGSGLLDTTG